MLVITCFLYHLRIEAVDFLRNEETDKVHLADLLSCFGKYTILLSGNRAFQKRKAKIKTKDANRALRFHRSVECFAAIPIRAIFESKT